MVIMEETIADAHSAMLNPLTAKRYRKLAKLRRDAINKYMWDEDKGYYFDFDLAEGKLKELPTSAGLFALYAGVASQKQADRVAAFANKNFLKPGGIVGTNINTGQQWDSPNGWPPQQWTAIRGLRKYGQDDLADEIKKRWIKTCETMYKRSGKLVEKYNVVSPDEPAGGGEYALQDGFGWSNGVLQALMHESQIDWTK
jgi:alpha,alpha-trehalase